MPGREHHVQQLSELWAGLSMRRRILAFLASAGMFVAVLLLARMASAPNLGLLYSGLEGTASGEVVAALEQRGVPYEVRGGSIFVDVAQRDELRMVLAGEGLPRNGVQGYELLDSLSGFGITSQMFDAAYWRAKEGELARTIAASPQVQSARVHIAHSGNRPFRKDTPPTASIFVTPASGSLAPAHARALRYLVASAVAGLMPENVAVMDSSGELIGNSDDTSQAPAGDDMAERMRDRVQRLLEARVGLGNVAVEVSVETETASESIRERRFDPTERVAISTESEERSNSSRNSDTGGAVTVASNLPDGGAGGGGDSSSQDSETRERVNYEVSATERELIRAPGAVRRLTVAVLVNGIAETAADGTVSTTPRDEAELAEMRELVASAVGFDEARGDVITLKSMTFQPVEMAGTPAAEGLIGGLSLDATRLVQMAVLAAVALILGLFVVRPLLMRRAEDVPLLARGAALPGPEEAAGEALTGEIDDGAFELPDLQIVSGFDGAGMAAMGEGGDTDPVQRLRELIADRREETLEILRFWLEDREEKV
ncbi:flagellar basal-body MS-ring/collar protein FliF [Pseudooceanicola pacificus]|uniref:flagellar basal-body MS-ring/collar protein FliF n=1 Tax=Pseudooceanicola pacificus TaxID=2676438 RepID=UPI001921C00D|nr:flagellar basal-body MS-ring/collar protein FliF [Pseudooceanicola pacificus]